MDKTNSNDRQGKRGVSRTMIFLLSLLLTAGLAVAGDESVVSTVPQVGPGPTVAEMASAQSRLPMLTDPSQIPLPVGAQAGDVGPMAFGTEDHPFTTKMASVTRNNRTPINQHPFNKTGKLWMRFGGSWFVCTASLIKPGVLVTAAHCVYEYGTGTQDGWADEVFFEPARFGSASGVYNLPFGTWAAVEYFIPSVYYNGTDICTVSGIVCENDIAVVVLEQSGGLNLSNFVGGNYAYYRNSNPYTSFGGMTAAQITQLGYPVAFESGYKMIRTDSLGYQATPNNVIIGSAQTGGSSGGPWIMNYGSTPSTTTSTPSYDHNNRVVAVTSWGYVSDTLKVQGASRFDTNTSFTTQANIDALLNFACLSYPGNC